MFIIDGAANGDLFEAYIEQIFAPTLHSGETVILDNLSIHKRQKVRELIEAKGCHLLFLPAYSPDGRTALSGGCAQRFDKIEHK